MPIASLGLLVLSSSAWADTLTVGPDGDFTTFGAAMAAAVDGDVVELSAGTYASTPLTVTNDVTVRGPSTARLQVRAGTLLAVVSGAKVRLEGIGVDLGYGGRLARVGTAALDLVGVDVTGTLDGHDPNAEGAVVLGSAGSVVTVTDSHLWGVGGGDHGGAFQVTGGTLAIEGGVVSGRATQGGCVWADGTAQVTVHGTELRGTADRGGWFYVLGAAHLLADEVGGSVDAPGAIGGMVFLKEQANVRLSGIDAVRGDDPGLPALNAMQGAVAASEGGARLELVDVAAGWSLSSAGPLYLDLHGLDDLAMTRVALCQAFFHGTAGEPTGSVVLDDVRHAELHNVLFWEQAGRPNHGAPVDTTHVAELVLDHVGFVGGGSTPITDSDFGAIAAQDAQVRLTNSLVLGTTGEDAAAGGSVGSSSFSAWWGNTPTDVAPGFTRAGADLRVDPGLVVPTFVDAGDCRLAAFRLLRGSPLIDAADPATQDPDGSPADIGFLGGPLAPAAAWEDTDADGVPAWLDCAPGDPTVGPAGAETCDGVDQDCDGVVDLPEPVDGTDWFLDEDGDGFGSVRVRACSQPEGTVPAGGDCNEDDELVHPGATERCNGIDDDCDGRTDVDPLEGLTRFEDADGDGHGDPALTVIACAGTEGLADVGDDCDDHASDVAPGLVETCDGLDQDCDAAIDEDATDAGTWFHDGDGDGAGSPDAPVVACSPPVGSVDRAGDCDDDDPAVVACVETPTGCGCTTSGDPRGLALLGLALLRRRRAR